MRGNYLFSVSRNGCTSDRFKLYDSVWSPWSRIHPAHSSEGHAPSLSTSQSREPCAARLPTSPPPFLPTSPRLVIILASQAIFAGALPLTCQPTLPNSPPPQLHITHPPCLSGDLRGSSLRRCGKHRGPRSQGDAHSQHRGALRAHLFSEPPAQPREPSHIPPESAGKREL